jgi:REP element-mobilizing transposase RayT
MLLAMTRGLVRYQQSGNFHFITFSCYQRLPHLGRAVMRDLFELSLERMRRRYGFVIAGYVVMPEHVHLLLSEPEVGSLDRAIQALKLSVTQQQAKRRYMCSLRGRRRRNCAICTGIRWCAGWWRVRKTGNGRVFGIIRPGLRGQWRLSRSGPRRGGVVNCRRGLDGRNPQVEGGAFPGLKSETWGTPVRAS